MVSGDGAGRGDERTTGAPSSSSRVTSTRARVGCLASECHRNYKREHRQLCDRVLSGRRRRIAESDNARGRGLLRRDITRKL